jgi:hypothetical protein
MKITKAKLKQIIKEELSRVLDENVPNPEFRTKVASREEVACNKVRAKYKPLEDEFSQAIRGMDAFSADLAHRISDMMDELKRDNPDCFEGAKE